MSYGKKQFSQKTREPYGKVTEVGQVPIALQEISEIASGIKPDDGPISLQSKAKAIKNMADSIITVTCVNPGCLSQMAEDGKAGIAWLVEGVFQRLPQSRENHIVGLSFDSSGQAIRFDYDGTRFRVDRQLFVEEVTENGLERSRRAQGLDHYLTMEVQS